MLPTPAEYRLAFELAEDNFNNRHITPVYENGKLWMSNHGFACVFKGMENGQPVAVKCFTKPITERKERYRLIADYLSKRSESCWTRFEYLPEEFYVDSTAGSKSYDVVLMPWIEGQTLGDYVAQACTRRDTAALQQLAQRFGQLGAWLLEQEFAHGDLKHDNIMVRPDGSLLLIDYDGMFVPALQERQALELGGQGYQNPARTAQHFDHHLDDFSILIISLSLHALAATPELYQEKTTDNLLLAQADLQNLQTSPILNRLFTLNHPEVNRLMMLLFQSLAAQSLHIPQLPALLPKREVLAKSYTETINGVSFNMIYVEGGTFLMGDTFGDGYDDERPVHEVHLDSYYIGETPVTQALWKVVMGTNPSRFKDCDNCPVETVSWEDTQQFIAKLNQRTGKKRYRLPTEAEWEYAARECGREVRFGNGQNILRPSEANFDASASHKKDYSAAGKYRGETTPVKSFQPNSLDLYDMSGNVWEWCNDWYDENYYQYSPRHNPQGPSSGFNRVLRGGSWFGVAVLCRVALRSHDLPAFSTAHLGLRLVRIA